jgi:hypothetical protein
MKTPRAPERPLLAWEMAGQKKVEPALGGKRGAGQPPYWERAAKVIERAVVAAEGPRGSKADAGRCHCQGGGPAWLFAPYRAGRFRSPGAGPPRGAAK